MSLYTYIGIYIYILQQEVKTRHVFYRLFLMLLKCFVKFSTIAETKQNIQRLATEFFKFKNF